MSSLIRAGQFAQVARQAAIILVALALPRLGIGRELIGQWESLLYVGYLLGFGWLTGLLQAYLVSVRKSKPAEAAAFSRMAVAGIGLFSLLLLALAAGLHQPLFSLLRLGEAPPGWWFFFVFLLTQWPGLFFEQVLLIREKPWWLIVFSGLSGLGFAGAMLLPLWLGEDLTFALSCLALLAGVKGLVILIWMALNREKSPYLPPPSDQRQPTLLPNYITTLLTTAWPLIAYASVGALVTAFDPWFVNYWYAGDEVIFATFRYGMRELPLLAALSNGLIIAVLPRLSEDASAGLLMLRNGSRRLYHWVFGGAILLMASSPWWWTVVFTDLFAESLPLFQLYLFVVVSRLLFPMPVIITLASPRYLSVFSLSELAMNAGLSILLAGPFGMMGIIFATVAADIINKLILMVYLYHSSQIKPGAYMDFRYFLTYVSGLVATYLWLV
jgi:hypothetical protein